MTVMISYSHNDWPIVEPVANFLRRSGIDLWIDREQIRPHMIWRVELLRAPRTTDAIIPFLSSSYINSEICRMELFLARSFDKPLFPVMLEECWSLLDSKEETRQISAIFAARLAGLKLVGLPASMEEILTRLMRAVQYKLSSTRADDQNVYISYPNGAANFATKIHAALLFSPIKPWVATMNCEVGDDWRKVQTQAMARAQAHVVVISEDLLGDNDAYRTEVLRTEILLSEAFQQPTLCVMSETLAANPDLRTQVYSRLANGEQAFRRLTERQWFRPDLLESDLRSEVIRMLALDGQH